MAGEWQYTPYGPFAADFAVARLVDLCDPEAGIQTGPFGSQLHQEDYVEVGTPIITVEHLGENRILHQDVPKVSDSDRDRLSRYLLRQGDIVFSRVGSVDRRALVRSDEDGWMFSGRCLRVRPDPTKIDSGYLSYLFGLPAFKEHVRAIAVGATMPSLNTTLLSELLIPFPTKIAEQRAIACILGTLDDKIELNRRMSQTLEAMARAIFKSWFVDFDPVKAKAAVRKEHPRWTDEQVSRAACPKLKPEIAALFPDSFEDSPLGPIPKGWRVGTVGENFRLTMGQSPPGETYNETGEGMPFYQGRTDFGFRFPTRRVYCTAPTRIAEAGDTLVSVRAPVGDVNMAIQRCAIGRGVAAIRHLRGGRSLTYYAMRNLATHFNRFEAEGTVFGSINKADFAKLPFLECPGTILDAFERHVAPTDDLIENLEHENVTLAALRDTLLPKLISGELRVKDAERIVGRAV